MDKQKKAKIDQVHVDEAARLKALFEARPAPRMSQGKFGETFEIGSQALVWQYLNARIPLNLEQAVRFARGLACSVDDFSPRLAAELAEYRDQLHAATENASDVSPSSDAPSPAAQLHSNVTDGPDIRGRVPLISWVQAGVWSEAVDIYEPGYAEDWLPVLRNGSQHSYALRVQGDSMTAAHGKSYPEGTVIIVDPDQRSPSSGQRIIAKLVGTNAVTFKVFVEEDGRRWLKPLNSQHPPIYDEFRVLGTVMAKYEPE